MDPESSVCRGITIKARAVAINYTLDGQVYELNLIDTPGHVDFHYEVYAARRRARGQFYRPTPPRASRPRRSPNAYLAVNNNLAIVPVLNKIDMQASAARRDQGRDFDQPGRIDPAEVLAIVPPRQGRGCPTSFGPSSSEFPHPAGESTRCCGPLSLIQSLTTTRALSPTFMVDGDSAGRPTDPIDGGRSTTYEVTGLEADFGRARWRVMSWKLACRQCGRHIKKLSDIRIGDTIAIVLLRVPGVAGSSGGLPRACAGGLLRVVSGHS